MVSFKAVRIFRVNTHLFIYLFILIMLCKENIGIQYTTYTYIFIRRSKILFYSIKVPVLPEKGLLRRRIR